MGWNNSVHMLGVPKTSVETLLRRALSGSPSFRFVYQSLRNNAILLKHGMYVLPKEISKQWNGPSELIHSFIIILNHLKAAVNLHYKDTDRRSQWQRGLRRRSEAARLPGLWVRIPPRAWMSVCCECFVLSGRGLCDELITRPEESYRLWCVVVCDLETS